MAARSNRGDLVKSSSFDTLPASFASDRDRSDSHGPHVEKVDDGLSPPHMMERRSWSSSALSLTPIDDPYLSRAVTGACEKDDGETTVDRSSSSTSFSTQTSTSMSVFTESSNYSTHSAGSSNGFASTKRISSNPVLLRKETSTDPHDPANVPQYVKIVVRKWGFVEAISPERFLLKLMLSRGYEAVAIPPLSSSMRHPPTEQQINDYFDSDVVDAVRSSDLRKLSALHQSGRR